MFRRPPFLIWIVVLALVAGFGATQTLAQTPKIFLNVNDTTAVPGAVVPVSIFLQNLEDSIQGFMLSLTLSRPDIMEFRADTTVQTCYKCSDTVCTSIVAYPCTVAVVPSSTVGTLTHSWEYVEARTFGSFDLQLTGMVDLNFDRSPLPILPYTNGVLIKVNGRVFCNIPDTLQDRTVIITANLVGSYFSNTKGQLIQPFSFTSGSVYIKPTHRGDMNSNGIIDINDVLRLIVVAFVNGEVCPAALGDVNCDGQININDVLFLIKHTFSNGPPPPC